MFRSCSKKIATTSVPTVKFSRNKEVTLNRVVRFIKVDSVYINTRLNNLLQRMISREDDTRLTRSASSIVEQLNLPCFSSAEELSITTMNVHHMNQIVLRKQFQKLFTELLSKENTRSNNYSSVATTVFMTQIILNHADGFTTTGGDDDLSFVVLQHGINCLLLMWAKGDGQSGVPFSMDIL